MTMQAELAVQCREHKEAGGVPARTISVQLACYIPDGSARPRTVCSTPGGLVAPKKTRQIAAVHSVSASWLRPGRAFFCIHAITAANLKEPG